MLQPGPAAELSQVYLQRVAQIVEKGRSDTGKSSASWAAGPLRGHPPLRPPDSHFAQDPAIHLFQTDHATGCQGEAERERCDREVRGGRVQVLPEVGDEVENTCPA